MNSTHPTRHGRLSAIAGFIFVAALAVAGTAGGPGQASAAAPKQPVAPVAARSVTVDLTNNLDCALVRFESNLTSGRWTAVPPGVIAARGHATWRSESTLMFTGTEGRAAYWTTGCTDPTRNHKTVKVHWKNPYFGRSDYDANGTDPAFRVSMNTSGIDQALVTLTLDNS